MTETSDRMLVISPHFDDAVFSCGILLANHGDATVLTVYSGIPQGDTLITPWDRACGFTSSGEAMRTRRREDDAALSVLGAESVLLDFLDDQYIGPEMHQRPAEDVLVAALERALDLQGVDTVLMPLGLFHSDHHRVHAACLEVFSKRPDLKWLAYEDALYRRMPGLLQRRLATLAQQGVEATPAFPEFPSSLAAKRHDSSDRGKITKQEAIAAYESQLKAFGPRGYGDLSAPEHYWHLGQIKDRDAERASDAA